MEDGSKPRDLEDRTFEFAQSVRTFVKQLPRTISNTEDVRQLVRASGSVAANWIEADEALSKKDFLMRVKICRKESKESRLFLRLVDAGLAKSNVSARDELAAEARELTLIFHRLSRRADNCPAFFWDLTIEFFLGFGNWDLELMRQQTRHSQDIGNTWIRTRGKTLFAGRQVA
jgi:four helix bundle protein